jgi:hypothetical protein
VVVIDDIGKKVGNQQRLKATDLLVVCCWVADWWWVSLKHNFFYNQQKHQLAPIVVVLFV